MFTWYIIGACEAWQPVNRDGRDGNYGGNDHDTGKHKGSGSDNDKASDNDDDINNN